MSLLTGLDKLIADVAGPLVFQRASLLRGSGYSISAATGQMVNTQTTEDIQVIEADYTDRHRASLDIPDQDRRLSILGYGVATPRPGDRVSVRGFIWEIVNIARDPAGALYDCQVKPITDDLAGDLGATANLLSGVAGLVSNVAGPLLFGDAVIFRVLTSTLDASGQSIRTTDIEFIKALEVEYSAFHRTDAGIPDTDRSLLILGQGLTAIPKPGDRVDINGLKYEIVRTGRDPARALYECQARPVGIAEILILAQHNVTLARQQLYATGERKFVFHAGVLARVIGEASGYTVGGAFTENTLARIIGTALAIAPVTASSDGLLARVYFGGSCALGASIEAGTVTGRAILSGAVSVLALASHAGTTGRATLAATATLTEVRSAAHAGTLGRITGAANAEALAGATGAATLARLDMAANATNAATAQSEGITGRPGLMAACDNLVVAVQAGTLGRAQGAGAATNATGAAQAATLGRATLGALGGALAAGAHAGALARAIFAGTATAVVPLDERTATHAGTLARLAGEATVQSFNTATLASTLARNVSTGTATLETGATQAATIARLLSTSSATVLASAAHAGALARSTLGATATVEAGGGYDADAEALIARMTLAPASWHQDLINACVVALKSDGTWDRLTALYLLNGQDKQASFLNWVAADSLSVVGSDITQLKPFFYMRSANVALATQTNYLETGYGVDAKYTESDCHYGAISSQWRSNGNYPVMMIGGFLASYIHDASNSQVTGRINNGPTYGFGTLEHGHYAYSQTGGQLTPYLDGVAHSAPITQGAPAADGTYNLFRTGSGIDQLSNAAMRAFHMGQSLTSGQMATLNSALTTYMDGVTMGGPVNPAYMVPEMVGTPRTIPQNTSNLPLPAGIVAGDIILVMGAKDGQTLATPSGFTTIRNVRAASVQLTAAYKVAVGGETSVTVASAAGQAWMSCVFRNVDAANPIDVTAPLLSDSQSLRTVWAPEITPVTDGCAIVLFAGMDDDVSTSVKHPDGYTPIASRQSGVSGTAITIMSAYKIKNKASIECPLPFTVQGAADAWHAISIALRPKAV